MIKKIHKISGLGLYKDETSFAETPDFKEINLIYGANGSGKTSFSRALRYMSSGELPDCLKRDNTSVDIEFIENSNPKAQRFNKAAPKIEIMVFNVDFVNENINFSTNNISGIRTTITKEADQLDELDKEFNVLRVKLEGNSKETKQVSTKIDILRNPVLANIKKLPQKAHYNITSLHSGILARIKGRREGVPLSSSEVKAKEAIVFNKDYTQIPEITFFNDQSVFKGLLQECITLLKKKIIIKEIIELKNDKDLQGLIDKLLQKSSKNKPCLFCDQPILPSRWEALAQHFTPEFSAHKVELEDLLVKISDFKEALTLKDYSNEKIHPSVNQDSVNVFANFFSSAKSFNALLSKMQGKLKSKLQDPINPIELSFEDSGNIRQVCSDYYTAYQKVADIIEEHNNSCQTHVKEQSIAIQKLVDHWEMSIKDKYLSYDEEKKQLENEKKDLEAKIIIKNAEISQKKAEVSDIAPSMAQINAYLKSYLGHERFKLEVDPTASGEGFYYISRGEKKSHAPPSEGEKTALALAYFACRLDNLGANIKDFIIVFDDPVSSFDNRNMFYAVQFIKKYIVPINNSQVAKQTFILTHSFAFYKEAMKKIGNNKKQQKLILESLKDEDNNIISKLNNLPDQLSDHESEYHYFVDKIIKANIKYHENDLIELHYYCRRVLETFCYFKIPDKSDQLIQKIESLCEDKMKYNALVRLCHVFSHGDSVDSIKEINDIMLESGREVVKQTLQLLFDKDEMHAEKLGITKLTVS